jgi:hypothetical protein
MLLDLDLINSDLSNNKDKQPEQQKLYNGILTIIKHPSLVKATNVVNQIISYLIIKGV